MPVGASIVGVRDLTFDLGNSSIGTAGNYKTFRSVWKNNSGKTIVRIQAVFGVWLKSGSTEAYLGNAVRVKCAFEHSGTKQTTATRKTPVKLQFAGQTTGLCDTLLVSDPIDVLIPNGDIGYFTTGITVDTNNHLYPHGGSVAGGTNYYGVDNGEAQDTSADVTYSGAMTAQVGAPIMGPVAIIGYAADGSQLRSCALLSDSIGAGTGDAGYTSSDSLMGGPNHGGWALRALYGLGYGFSKHSIGGEAWSHLAAYLAAAPFTSVRAQVAAMHTHVLLAYGRNDLGDALATIQANVKSVCSWFLARGLKVGVATVLPAPSSSDGFVTFANQTADSSTRRNQLNAWLVDTSSSGAKAQIEAYCASTYGNCPGSLTVLDICANYEYNTSGVLTVGGGCIPAYTGSNQRTGTAAASTDQSVIKDSLMTPNAYRGYTIQMTSGPAAGECRNIQYNNTTDIVPDTAFNAVPVAGNTYKIHSGRGQNSTASGASIHPAGFGHSDIAAGILTPITAWMGS